MIPVGQPCDGYCRRRNYYQILRSQALSKNPPLGTLWDLRTLVVWYGILVESKSFSDLEPNPELCNFCFLSLNYAN